MILGSLEETSSTLHLRGAVVAAANAGKTVVDSIKLTLSNASKTSEAVDLSSTGTAVTSVDDDHGLNCTGSGSPSCSWTTTWLIGSGDLVDPGEQVDITSTISSLTPVFGTSKEFTIQVKPNKGAVISVTREIPGEIEAGRIAGRSHRLSAAHATANPPD